MSPIHYLAQGYSKLFIFSGTACRQEFWWMFAASIGLLILSVQLTILLPELATWPLIALGLGAFVFGMLSVSVRRLRDARRSPFWLLAPPVAAVFLWQSSSIQPTPPLSDQSDCQQDQNPCKQVA